ncbi:MAG TPA: hypothetical protein H9830_02940 [Candidatus Agrococcus pullicola]|uniref:Uncharacterized protein n=1 Tax=Candidatus Agrococcus pullicola TaxID=2838429 RepID=A0A9D1YU75_9MICO|nr:hypothetical protein [Candidatus Agrococcus pullicola]
MSGLALEESPDEELLDALESISDESRPSGRRPFWLLGLIVVMSLLVAAYVPVFWGSFMDSPLAQTDFWQAIVTLFVLLSAL